MGKPAASVEIGHVGAKRKLIEKTSKKLSADVEAGVSLLGKNVVRVLCDYRRACVDSPESIFWQSRFHFQYGLSTDSMRDVVPGFGPQVLAVHPSQLTSNHDKTPIGDGSGLSPQPASKGNRDHSSVLFKC